MCSGTRIALVRMCLPLLAAIGLPHPRARPLNDAHLHGDPPIRNGSALHS